MSYPTTRRTFLAAAGLATSGLATSCLAALDRPAFAEEPSPEPIIDIHQHTNYTGRSDALLLAHQQAMGVTRTILLPAGTPVSRASTHRGRSNGLAAMAGGNESCAAFAEAHPDQYRYFANEVADLPEARATIEKYLKAGALGIGEQKFAVELDSPHVLMLCELAQEYRVPLLMHFQHGMYNTGFERFGKLLEKFPKVNFIGHAQTWWANIDRNHADQAVLYPKTKVTPGGLTDRYLADHPNAFADMSAGSGLNALLRDEDHARDFIDRHQDKLLFGSDCNDRVGQGPQCQGAQIIATIRKLSPTKAVERKLLHDNAKGLFRL